MAGIYWFKTGKRRTEERYGELLNHWPVRFERNRIPTRQGETSVLVCGPQGAPPLVLLHGGLSNSLMWMAYVKTWAQHFRIYSVDTIGDPGFSAPSRPSFKTDEHAKWLDEVWDALALPQALVVGWSLGGWLGIDYAVRHPGRVRALACLAPAGIVRIRHSAILKLVSLVILGSWGREKAFLWSMGFDDNVPDGINPFVEFSLAAQKAVKGRLKLPVLFTDQALRALQVPMMTVFGERDVFFDALGAKARLAACVRNSEVHTLTGKGHGLFGCNDLVLPFLRRESA